MVEIARKEKPQWEPQPVVVPRLRPAAAAAAAPKDANMGEAEDAAEDEHEPLEGLFAVRKSSSGASIGEPSTAAGTGAQEGEDRMCAMTKSLVNASFLTFRHCG